MASLSELHSCTIAQNVQERCTVVRQIPVIHRVLEVQFTAILTERITGSTDYSTKFRWFSDWPLNVAYHFRLVVLKQAWFPLHFTAHLHQDFTQPVLPTKAFPVHGKDYTPIDVIVPVTVQNVAIASFQQLFT